MRRSGFTLVELLLALGLLSVLVIALVRLLDTSLRAGRSHDSPNRINLQHAIPFPPLQVDFILEFDACFSNEKALLVSIESFGLEFLGRNLADVPDHMRNGLAGVIASLGTLLDINT